MRDEVDAVLAGEPTRQRRDDVPPAIFAGPKLRAGVRTSKNGSSGPAACDARCRCGDRGAHGRGWTLSAAAAAAAALRSRGRARGRAALARDHRDHGADQRRLAGLHLDLGQRAGW